MVPSCSTKLRNSSAVVSHSDNSFPKHHLCFGVKAFQFSLNTREAKSKKEVCDTSFCESEEHEDSGREIRVKNCNNISSGTFANKFCEVCLLNVW